MTTWLMILDPASIPDGVRSDEPALLVSGDWPGKPPAGAVQLDDVLDESWDRLEIETQALAEKWERDASPAQQISALSARHLLHGLVRTAHYYTVVNPPPTGTTLRLYGPAAALAVFAALAESLASRWQGTVEVKAPRTAPSRDRAAPRKTSIVANWRKRVRGWLHHEIFSPTRVSRATAESSAPQVLFVGDPRVMAPAAVEMRRRGWDVTWWWQNVNLRWATWLGWRGVRSREILPAAPREDGLPAVETSRRPRREGDPAAVLATAEGVDVAAAMRVWWKQERQRTSDSGERLWTSAGEAWRAAPPRLVVVDHDTSSLQRAAVLLARQNGDASIVVQHGLPSSRFGFLPLAADGLCAWGTTSAEQLREWGLDPGKVWVTGAPGHDGSFGPAAAAAIVRRTRRTSARSTTRRATRLLFLASACPREDRPDAVAPHWTPEGQQQLWETVAEAARRRPDVIVAIRPHPRAGRRKEAARALTRAGVPSRQWKWASGPIERWVDWADAALSVGGAAGAEALARGTPVVQWLPAGASDPLPPQKWGWASTVHDAEGLLAALDSLEAEAALDRLNASSGVDSVPSGPALSEVLANALRPSAPILATVAETLSERTIQRREALLPKTPWRNTARTKAA